MPVGAEIIIIGLIVVVVVVGFASRAVGIAKAHSTTLSFRTGIPATQIYREMRTRNLTPGEWAARHGLDPVTFEPRNSQSEQPRVLAEAAAEDPDATQFAQMALQSWHSDFADVIREAVAQAPHDCPPERAFIEAYSTVCAVKDSVQRGDIPGNTVGVYNEIALIGREHAQAGMSKGWVVALWMLRQHSALIGMRAYLGETPELEQALEEWKAAREAFEGDGGR